MTSESTSIMLNLEVALHETEDLERRRQLRAFLMLYRSRLIPDELGLPRTDAPPCRRLAARRGR
jgi:hypothetical protein